MTGQDPVVAEPNPSKRASRHLATSRATVVLAAITAVAVTAAPAAAGPPIGTTNCVTICLTWTNILDYTDVNAWSLYDVTYTPYWITIFDAHTGYKITTCGTGTQCSAELGSAQICDPTIAYIGSYTATMPPRIVVASSGVMTNERCPPA